MLYQEEDQEKELMLIMLIRRIIVITIIEQIILNGHHVELMQHMKNLSKILKKFKNQLYF